MVISVRISNSHEFAFLIRPYLASMPCFHALLIECTHSMVIHFQYNIYTTYKSDIGRQFFSIVLSSSPFGIQEITQCRKLQDIVPILKANLAEQSIKCFNCPQKTLKNSSVPGVFPFFMFFQGLTKLFYRYFMLQSIGVYINIYT